MSYLQKKNWKEVPLGDLCEIKRGNTITKLQVKDGDIPVVASAVGISYYHNQSNREGEIITISASGVNAGYVEYYIQPIFASDCITIQPLPKNNLNLRFVYYSLKAKQNAITSFQRGTAQAHVYPKDLIPMKTFYPSLPEQTQIAELFQSIETAIEQAEQQEKNLKALQKTLSNGLVNTQPTFGNLLNKKNCTLTNFGGVADCDVQHDKEKKDVTRFIGLENIESENLNITTWGNIADGTTFTKRFSKGDVLFGKRRAYLKKVAIANFDGICSGDILVLKAKEKKMLPTLLPFYVSAEAFIQHAVSTSAGSLSPRTKWKDLSSFEIAIPDLKTQEKIVEVFQQIQTTLAQITSQKQTLKNLKNKLLNEILG